MIEKNIPAFEYDGDYYKEAGDFLGGEAYLEYGFTKGTQQEVDFLTELMELPAGSRILDVGCGAGRHSLELARRGYRPTGIDITPAFIDYARRIARDEHLAAEFSVADARELNFTQEFDAAICLCEGAFGLAGSLDNHRKVLRGIYRALKPGGLFVLTAIHALFTARNNDPDKIDAYTCTSWDAETLRNAEGDTKEMTLCTTGFTFRELQWLFEEAGFEVLAGYGCIAGNFRRKPLGVGDIEIMAIGRRT
jgi:ubiquinone/menaquinone biosynthesis C-methylase UbiE